MVLAVACSNAKTSEALGIKDIGIHAAPASLDTGCKAEAPQGFFGLLKDGRRFLNEEGFLKKFFFHTYKSPRLFSAVFSMGLDKFSVPGKFFKIPAPCFPLCPGVGTDYIG